MKQKSIESVIVEVTGMPKGFLPLDVLLIKGTTFTDENKDKVQKVTDPIIVKSIGYKGHQRKVPYAPISTIFSVDFEQ